MHELNLFCFITNLAVAAICGALLPILPALTRKTNLFGVSIPASEHGCPEAAAMTRSYVAISLAGAAAIAALCVAQYVAAPDLTVVAMMYFPLLFGVLQMAAFVPNWRKALDLKEERRWKATATSFAETRSSHSRGKLAELPWAWYMAGLAAIVASVAASLLKYPSIPDRIPTHYDMRMVPDGWADKSILAVLAMPLANLGILLLVWLAGASVVKGRLQLDPGDPELSFAQHRIYRRRMGHSLGFLSLSIVALMALLGFSSITPGFGLPFWAIMALATVPIAPVLAVTVTSGQGGGLIKVAKSAKGTGSGGGGEAGAYKGGGGGEHGVWDAGAYKGGSGGAGDA
jgi:uncharacterized membrane protein